MALNKGSKAPNFTLPSTSGDDFILSENLPCVLYFYPKDFTAGCTKEACYFRDEFAVFRELNINVFGINRDTIPTHQKFKAKHQLPFELISDLKGNIIKSYDANIPFVKMTKRITYLINKEGIIESVYDDLFGAEKHIKEMISALKD